MDGGGGSLSWRDLMFYYMYRAEKKSLQILLSRTQAGPGRKVKQVQEEISRNHVPRFFLSSVCAILAGVRGVLDPPVLAAQLLAGVRAGLPHPVAARHDPRGADRAHGQRLLHHGAHHRAIPRRLLPLPPQEVSRRRRRRLINSDVMSASIPEAAVCVCVLVLFSETHDMCSIRGTC